MCSDTAPPLEIWSVPKYPIRFYWRERHWAGIKECLDNEILQCCEEVWNWGNPNGSKHHTCVVPQLENKL